MTLPLSPFRNVKPLCSPLFHSIWCLFVCAREWDLYLFTAFLLFTTFHFVFVCVRQFVEGRTKNHKKAQTPRGYGEWKLTLQARTLNWAVSESFSMLLMLGSENDGKFQWFHLVRCSTERLDIGTKTNFFHFHFTFFSSLSEQQKGKPSKQIKAAALYILSELGVLCVCASNQRISQPLIQIWLSFTLTADFYPTKSIHSQNLISCWATRNEFTIFRRN